MIEVTKIHFSNKIGMEEQKMLFDMFAVTWVRLKKYGLGQFKIFIS